MLCADHQHASHQVWCSSWLCSVAHTLSYALLCTESYARMLCADQQHASHHVWCSSWLCSAAHTLPYALLCIDLYTGMLCADQQHASYMCGAARGSALLHTH